MGKEALMNYSTSHVGLLASLFHDVEQELRELIQNNTDAILQPILKLLTGGVTPESTFAFEEALAEAGHELLRKLTEYTFNSLESEDSDRMPKIVRFESGEYRKENQKTPNRNVSTRFGEITLWRFPYRYRQRESKPGIFPLELQLGLVGGATPAIADLAARSMAETGSTQRRVLEKLKREHNVTWGVKRLREVTSTHAESYQAYRHQFQVAKLLDLLEQPAVDDQFF